MVLVVGAVVLGGRLLASDDDTVVAFRATRDLLVGSRPTDLEPVRVSREVAADRYVLASPDDGLVLLTPVRAGELVPVASLGAVDVADRRTVTVPVDPLHAPPAIQPGDRVDVWASPRPNETGEPTLVLADVSVADVSMDDLGLRGEVAVVLSIPAEEVASVVAASRTAVIDLVAVPIGSQEPGTGPSGGTAVAEGEVIR